MYLTDLHVDRFGQVSDLSLTDLSGRITMFWGPNGSGKSTVVRFLRGLLFGLSEADSKSAAAGASEGGWLQFRSASPTLRRIRRARHQDGTETYRLEDALDGQLAVAQSRHLPDWVSAEVFREIFSAGCEEADRFDLLTRLCVESGLNTAPVESEIHSTELALMEVVHERDGHGSREGVVQRIADVRQRRADLIAELKSLHRVPANLPERIQLLNSEIEAFLRDNDQTEIRLRELNGECEGLNRQLHDLRCRNILPLDRGGIELRIRTLSARRDRWRAISEAIAQESVAMNSDGDRDMRPHESLVSLRALVTRLESRLRELTSDRHLTGDDSSPEDSIQPELRGDSTQVSLLRSELNALCRYLTHHEDSVALHEAALELHFADRCLSQARDVETLLQERIAGLRSELDRSADILDAATLPDTDQRCRNVDHPLMGVASTQNTQFRSIDEVESELMRLQEEMRRLAEERSVRDEAAQTKRALLDQLRQELAGAATLEQIDSVRGRISAADAQLVLLEERLQQLGQTEVSLRQVMERLMRHCQPRVLESASEFMRRLTDGECTQILWSGSPEPQLLFQLARHSDPLPVSQLSRGTRHQAALALRLALIKTRLQKGLHVPLILDDVFITSDDSRATAVVELLSEIAAAGQQIIFFTCQKDVHDLFLRFHADVRPFRNRAPIPVATVADSPITDDVPVPIPALKAYVEEPRSLPDADLSPPVLAEPVVSSRPIETFASNWLFYLEIDHRVDDLAGITLGELDAFRAMEIHTISDLFQSGGTQLEERARRHGYRISSERLDALRGQAQLTCRVPMLRRSDAALIYAAGIRTAEELAALRPETLHERIVAFQQTEAGARYRRAGRLIDRQQAINWARWGQHSRSMEDVRTSRSRFCPRNASAAQPQAGPAATETSVPRRQRIRTDNSPTRRRLPTGQEADSPQRRARRLARRRRIASRLRSSAMVTAPAGSVPSPEVDRMERSTQTMTANGKQLRFFLSRVSDVEDAPSIGPKTAALLRNAGIRTVDDLLNAEPGRLTQKISHRRITSAIVTQWQTQARLMCLVPELRGHDVQILVACGITEPDDLAERDPVELTAVVAPLSASTEGKRIIRSSHPPDLAEVTDWVNCARSARSFRAA